MKKLNPFSSLFVRKNFFLIMKLKIFIILMAAFQISAVAYSQEGRLSLNMKNVSIEQVLKEIQAQSEYEFFYAHEEISTDKRMDIDLSDATIEEVIEKCFEDLDLEYEIVDKVIVIKPSTKVKVFESEAQAPKITVNGRVIDAEDGSGIPGVTVLVKGTTTGITTDINGSYTLEVADENVVLVFSYIGFEAQEVIVGNQTTIDIALSSSAQELEEVIVTAIGTTVIVDQTGITSSVVKTEEMGKSGEAGVINALSGKASGVQIRRSNGDPGAGSAISIRGTNTFFGNSQPLIIVDGAPYSNDNIDYGAELTQQSRLNDISSEDIESIQILKGAAAAAIWGSRAANGVLVITTKNGKLEQKPQVTYSFTSSFDNVSVKMPLQNTYGQGTNGVYNAYTMNSWGDKISDRSGGADVVDQSGKYFVGDQTGKTYYPILEKNSKETYRDSNYDKVFQTGHFNKHNVSVTGGGKSTSYYVGLERLDQEGIVNNFTYDRTNFRINTQTHLYDWLKFNNKVAYTNVNTNRIMQAGDNTNGVFLGLYRGAADFDITDYTGTYVDASGEAFQRQRSYRKPLGSNINPTYNNPMWTMYEQQMPDVVEHFVLTPELMITPAGWIKFILRTGVDYYNDTRNEFYPVGSASNASKYGRMDQQVIQSKEINVDAIAILNHKFNKDIDLTGTLGFNYNDYSRSINRNVLTPFLVASDIQTTSLDGGSNENTSWDKLLKETRTNRAYSMVALSLYDQLFINASGTVEAASTLPENFFYPSTDIAWQFTDNFESKVLSFGKFRVAWGKVGLAPDPYKFQILSQAAYSSFGGGTFAFDAARSSINLAPEMKTEWEIGTDLRFFDNKLSLDFTYYDNITKGILYDVEINPSSGYLENYTNAATMSNKGIEIDLNAKIIEEKDLRFSVYANFNRNRNMVEDLGGGDIVNIGGTSKAVVGYPISVFYTPGAMRDEDGELILHDGVTKYNGSTQGAGFPIFEASNRVIGDPNPDWRGGIGANLNYKNFDLSILFEHSHGGEFINRTNVVLYGIGAHADVANEVTLTEDLVTYTGNVISAGTTVRGNIHDFGGGDVLLDQDFYTKHGGGFGFSKFNFMYVDDATWTKLRNVTIGYTFDNVKLSSKLAFKSVRLSVTGRDLLLWTKVRDVDPETNNYGVSTVSGMNYFNSPGTRSVLFNLKVNL